MSSMYFECSKYDYNQVAQTNTDGTAKCPMMWYIAETSELANRYRDVFDKPAVLLNTFELADIPIKTKKYKSEIIPQLILNLYVESSTLTEYDILIAFGDDFTEYTILTNEVDTLIIDVPENSSRIEIVNFLEEQLNVFQDYRVEFKTNIIDDIKDEFDSFSIDPHLVDSVTIANTIRQRKTKKTKVEYKNTFIIYPYQNDEILDVLAFARLNKLETLIYINYTEEAGNTLANYPQESEYLKYYFNKHIGTQESGLYKYLTITYQSDNTVGVFS